MKPYILDFVRKNCVDLFASLGANKKITDLWLANSHIMHDIIASKMVQGMQDNSLTRERFDNLYMKPDVIYIYNLGVALQERAKAADPETQKNIMMIAEMFMGYETKEKRFSKYNLQLTDLLNDERCIAHTKFLSQQTSVSEYYVAILTDMMPYVAFANYLYNSIDTDDNIWMAYAKKYGTVDSEYASQKLRKSIELANKVLDENAISYERAAELFQTGLDFERYFIEESMEGNLQPEIIAGSNTGCPPDL